MRPAEGAPTLDADMRRRLGQAYHLLLSLAQQNAAARESLPSETQAAATDAPSYESAAQPEGYHNEH